MALGVWQNTIRDSSGRIKPGASVHVVDSDSGIDRDLFSDRNSAVAILNPCTADADGIARFYTAVGRVDITITYGSKSITLENMPIISTILGEGIAS